MNSIKAMSLLGLANRARKVISGEELVLKEVKRNSAKLVLISRDASENTAKRMQDKCQYYKVKLCFVESREMLGNAIGKDERVVVAVTEQGFAQKLASLLES